MKAVVFDLYNTLIKVNGPDPVREFIKLVPKSCSASVMNAAVTRPLHSLDDMRNMVRREYNIHFRGDDMEERLEALRARVDTIERQTELFPDVIPTLDRLAAEEIPIGLVSNLSAIHIKPFYAHGLDKYFPDPVFSCDIGCRKPDKRIFLVACRRLGVAPQDTLMVGDSKECDVDGAINAGLKAILLQRDGYTPRNHIRSLAEVNVDPPQRYTW